MAAIPRIDITKLAVGIKKLEPLRQAVFRVPSTDSYQSSSSTIVEMRTNISLKTRGTPEQTVVKPTATLIVIPLVVLAAFSPWLAATDSMGAAFLIAAQLVVCSLGVARSFSSGTRPVALVYFMFTFAWLGIGPAYQVSHDQMAWRDYTILANESLVIRTLVLNVLATTMVFCGTEVQRHRQRSQKQPRVSIAKSKNGGAYLWCYLFGAVLLTPLAVRAAGGLSTMFESRAARGNALANAGLSLAQAGGLQVALVTILPSALSIAGASLAGVRLRRNIRLGIVRPSDIIALALAVSLLFLFCNPFANSRFITSLAFGSLIITLLRPTSIHAGRIFAFIALLGTAIIYPLAEIFRKGLDSASSLRSGAQAFASMDFDGFQQIANAIVYVEDFGHGWGHYTASALFYFIPRSIWEGKATPASLDVAANHGYSFTNLSLPLPAEMYIEFGWMGMVVVLFMLGYLFSRIDDAWLQGGVTSLGVLAPVMALSILGLVRGPLGSLAPVYLTTILLILLAVAGRTETPHSRTRNA